MKRLTIISAALSALTALSAGAQNYVPVRTLSLQECMEMASGGNVEVRNTHLDYLSAKMQKREALASYFPVIQASAMGFRAVNPLVRIGLGDVLGTSDAANNLKYYLETEAQMNGINTMYETLSSAYGAGLTLTQPVFAGGRIVNGNRLASLGIESATIQENISRRDLISQVESKYWLVVSLEEKLSVVDQAIALSDSLLKDTQAALDAGLLTDDERDRVLMKRQELRFQRVRLKGGIMLAKMDLCESVGMTGAEALSLTLSDKMPVPDSPKTYWRDPDEAVAALDESRLLDLAVRQKQIEKNMAMGEALPQIGVGASYGYGHMIGSPQMNGAVYATVKIPITDWSKASSRMRRLEYQKEKAENDRSHYTAMLSLKVRQLWVEVEASWEELSLKRENVEYARKAADRAESDMAAGLATAAERMEKSVALSNACCEEVDARAAYRNAVNAYQALAGGQ